MKKDILKKLKNEAKAASEVYLATDPDREGEAIAWHVADALRLSSSDASLMASTSLTAKSPRPPPLS